MPAAGTYKRVRHPGRLEDPLLRRMGQTSARRRSVVRSRWGINNSVVPRQYFHKNPNLAQCIEVVTGFSDLVHKRLTATRAFLDSARGKPGMDAIFDRQVAAAEANLPVLELLYVHIGGELKYLTERAERFGEAAPEEVRQALERVNQLEHLRARAAEYRKILHEARVSPHRLDYAISSKRQPFREGAKSLRRGRMTEADRAVLVREIEIIERMITRLEAGGNV